MLEGYPVRLLSHKGINKGLVIYCQGGPGLLKISMVQRGSMKIFALLMMGLREKKDKRHTVSEKQPSKFYGAYLHNSYIDFKG